MNKPAPPLYEFKVMVEEDPTAEVPYRLYVTFTGDPDFYEKLIEVAKDDRVLFTGRTAPFIVKLIHREKYFFYFEQETDKKSKYAQWKLEDILRKEYDLLTFQDREYVIEFRKALWNNLNLFAKEVALKY